MDSHVEKIRNSMLANAPEVFSKRPVLFAYLYGSYVTGVVHPHSDLDIGIYIENLQENMHLELELSLSLEFDNLLKTAGTSEVRIINNLPLVILGNIVTEGILIYSRDDALRVDFETSVRSAYFDFLHAIRKYNNEYINHVCS